MHSHDSPSLSSLIGFAREMRKEPTRSEALLWAQVRDGKLGVRVRRQHVLSPFIVDFFVASRRLVIEIDSGVHRARGERDAARDVLLVRVYGVRILRIEADLIERDVRAALALVRTALS